MKTTLIKRRHPAFLEVAVTVCDVICFNTHRCQYHDTVMMGRKNAGGVMTELPYVETCLDSKSDVPATDPELMQALLVLSSASSDGMTLVNIQAAVITQKQKSVQQTMSTLFQPKGS